MVAQVLTKGEGDQRDCAERVDDGRVRAGSLNGPCRKARLP